SPDLQHQNHPSWIERGEDQVDLVANRIAGEHTVEIAVTKVRLRSGRGPTFEAHLLDDSVVEGPLQARGGLLLCSGHQLSLRSSVTSSGPKVRIASAVKAHLKRSCAHSLRLTKARI